MISAEQWILVACGVAGLVTIEKVGEGFLTVLNDGVSGLLPTKGGRP